MSAEPYDVAICGAGPAGCAAAISAARRGARVLLLERGRYPRQKVCGEFLSPEGVALLRQLDPMLPQELFQDGLQITCARLFVDRKCVQVPLESAAASVTRYALDHALWRSAIRTGADCRQQVTVTSVHSSSLASNAGEFEAKSVIVSAGRWSNLRQPNHKRTAPDGYIGLKAHFAEKEPPSSVDLYFFSGGYCGVQAVGPGRVNVCAVARASIARALTDVFPLNVALRERSRSWSLLEGPISTAQLVFGKPVPVDDGLIYVGDAAGFIDPFVGDGISLALRSGVIAAECLACVWREGATVADAAQQYATRYRKQLAPLFRNAALLRRMTSLNATLQSNAVTAMQIPSIARWVLSSTRASA
ncbi:MAG: NAD(P)/FAD-dependent oxidoreductase [Acidobacteria bacterium]|nr:NAD(P)/FAD-dependent oxidoreductase [Acidobacteriaceae bacterium]MBV9609066.1 NAD(P)/FAD-dependent oxidoreductase [Acidobacteriota bacterium]